MTATYEGAALRTFFDRLPFSIEDYKDLVADNACGKIGRVQDVYSAAGLNPTESNMVDVLSVYPNRPVQRKCLLPFDWYGLVDHLPQGMRTAEAYLSHAVPFSLAKIADAKLEPARSQFLKDRAYLLEHGVSIPTGRKIIAFLRDPLKTIGHDNAGDELRKQRAVDNAHLRVRRELLMALTDGLVVQYFEDFEDANSWNHRLRIAGLADFASLFGTGDRNALRKELDFMA